MYKDKIAKLFQNKWVWLGGAVLLVAVLQFTGKPATPPKQGNIHIPQFSPVAQAGQKLFEKNCMACHGKNATGSRQGPPLVHRIYRPAHHADRSFYRAARRGVRAHHWPFGNMPPITTVTPDDVRKIITYIRELQQANGIS